jgi:hypothetical protein
MMYVFFLTYVDFTFLTIPEIPDIQEPNTQEHNTQEPDTGTRHAGT